MIPSYPKIWALGSEPVKNVLADPVEITEKIDGSQFAFGVDEHGEIVMRSKGKELFSNAMEKMFGKAAALVEQKSSILKRIWRSTYFYGEFLAKPKHNVLNYIRVPQGGVMLFSAIYDNDFVDYSTLSSMADMIGLETVPLLYSGVVSDMAQLDVLLKTPSVLGNETVEGVVIKNYAQRVAIGNVVMPAFAKYVRSEYKERHAKEWGTNTGKSKVEDFVESFRTEVRWQKAIQHLREGGQLQNAPQDIGVLIREIERDLFEEETENIKAALFRLYRDDIARKAKAGFPEWYKERLAQDAIGVKR